QLDTAALRAMAKAGTLLPLLRDLVPMPGRRTAGSTGLAQQLIGKSDAEQHELTLRLVSATTAIVLGYPSPQAVGSDRAFMDLGFSSLTAIELRNQLNAATGLRLPATLIFDYPTPAALARYLQAEVIPDSAGTTNSSGEEAEIRRIFAAIPLDHMRRSGL